MPIGAKLLRGSRSQCPRHAKGHDTAREAAIEHKMHEEDVFYLLQLFSLTRVL